MSEEQETLGPPDPEKFKPGSFGAHEAMHEASLLMKWAFELSEHPAIQLNKEWEARATRIGEELYDLYHEIALAHLDAADRPEGGSHGKESIRENRRGSR